MRLPRAHQLPLSLSGRRRLAAVVALLGVATLGLAPRPADAVEGPAAPIDECDWTSLRNGLGNPGASECVELGLANVVTLRPQLLYRTRDSVTSTPAVVGDRLYVGSWDGTFYAFDTTATGFGDPSWSGQPFATVEPLWTFQVDDSNGVSFGRIVSSASVADVAGTRVVLFAGGATVYALDAVDGSLLAKLCLDPRSEADAAATGGRCAGSGDSEVEVESSPMVVPHPDGSVRILIGQDNHNRPGLGRTGVVELRLKAVGGDEWSLTPEWKFDPEARVAYDAAGEGADFLTHLSGTGDGCGGVWGTPAVDPERDIVVFGTASCGRDPAGGPGDTGDVAGEKVYAVRYSTGEELWRFDPPRPWGTDMDDDFGAAVQLFEVDGDLIAGAAGKDGWYYALDAGSGQVVWRTQVGQPGHTTEGFAVGGVLGSPALGVANVVDPGSLLRVPRPALFVTTAISTPVGAPLDSGSLDALDRTLLEDPGRMLSLHAVDAATGQVLWRTPVTRQTYGHPTYANGLVLVASTVGLAVEAFHADTGTLLWRSPLNGAPSSGVAVAGDAVYLGAGTRQTDAGFKLEGDDSVVPDGLREAVEAAGAAEHVGSDPQERLSGVWSFRAAGGSALPRRA